MEITSCKNEKIKELQKLKSKKYRDETGLFLVEGNHLVDSAIEHNCVVETLARSHSYKADIYVTEEIMKKITSQETPPMICAVCKKTLEKPISGKILILDQIQDPGNLGTIIRSAVAFQFSTIILSLDSVDLYNEKVLRSTEGLLFDINVIRKDLNEVLIELKAQNYLILGTNVKNGQPIKYYKNKEKIAIIIGNEGQGMKTSLEKYIESSIYIPLSKQCESLNAGVCASIIMYELGDLNGND